MIEDILKYTGLSQEKFGKVVGVSQRVVSNWLHEQSMPNSDSLFAIYKTFGITPNECLGIDEYEGVREEIYQAKLKIIETKV